jgi:ribosomal protein S18 acetylase RimI-like enzyme
MNAVVLRADSSHLEVLIPLFTGYRQFYEQSPDPQADKAFLAKRLDLKDSVIFLALSDDKAKQASGFVQLYPSFDSVEVGPIWILHDLYVAEDFRRSGTGRLLMNTARDFCRATEAVRIDLATAVTNKKAQALYESLGYERDDEFYHFSLSL